jgi:hypothetical protein
MVNLNVAIVVPVMEVPSADTTAYILCARTVWEAAFARIFARRPCACRVEEAAFARIFGDGANVHCADRAAEFVSIKSSE